MGLEFEFERARELEDEQGFASLPVRDRVLIAIWCLESEVNNGGFDQFYFNSAGDYAHVVPEMLKAIEAHRMAAIVERANAQFGEGGPPLDRDERQDALEQLTKAGVSFEQFDKEFWAYPDDVAGLLENYLRVQPVA